MGAVPGAVCLCCFAAAFGLGADSDCLRVLGLCTVLVAVVSCEDAEVGRCPVAVCVAPDTDEWVALLLLPLLTGSQLPRCGSDLDSWGSWSAAASLSLTRYDLLDWVLV